MTPEAAACLGKARDDLKDARTIAAIGLAKVAARSAYYAGFHAAQAYIVERTGKIAKTHSGLRTAFARLSKETTEIDRAFSSFLAKAYTYKEISDYGVGPSAVITIAEAVEAIEMAARMIDRIAALLGDRS